MKLSKIISEKQDKCQVITIEESSTLTQAAKLFCKHHIGALLVKKNNKYVGIITERDIIKMCSYESEFYKINVTELMTEEIISCNISDDIQHALKIMTTHNIRHIPVYENDEIIGVISIGDILKQLYEEDEIVLHDISDLTGSTSRNKVF